MRLNRTATLAIALMIAPVALLRSGDDGASAAEQGTAVSMSTEAHQTMDAWLAALNAGALSGLDMIVADTLRVDGRATSRDEFRSMIAAWREHAGPREARVMPLVTDGQLVGLWTWSEPSSLATRSAGVGAPERAHWLGADFVRIEDGRIVEAWLHSGRLGLRRNQR